VIFGGGSFALNALLLPAGIPFSRGAEITSVRVLNQGVAASVSRMKADIQICTCDLRLTLGYCGSAWPN
jgi:hypothetical protein